GDRGDPAAALPSGRAVAGVGQEEAAVGAEEGPEAVPARVGGGRGALLEEAGEIGLGQVGGRGGGVPPAAGPRADRRTVRRDRLGFGPAGRGEDPAPSGRREAGGRWRRLGQDQAPRARETSGVGGIPRPLSSHSTAWRPGPQYPRSAREGGPGPVRCPEPVAR